MHRVSINQIRQSYHTFVLRYKRLTPSTAFIMSWVNFHNLLPFDIAKMNIWASFVIHVIYRLFRFIVHFTQSIKFRKWKGVNEQLVDFDADCEIMSIVCRRKIVGGDTPGANDFIWWHDKFVKAKDVLALDPCWTLYTLDQEFAYFVLMPKPWSAYHAREAPFVFMRQYEDATKLARMPLSAFCRFANESLPEPKGPVVYYSNTARSGTTLLTRIMQVSEKRIRCFGEPDAFTALTMFQQRGLINEDLAVDLLRASFKFYCKTQEPGQTYLMKIASNGARLVPLVKKAMPNVKHMFTSRRNTRGVISSLEKILRGATAGDVWVTLWKLSPEVACRMINVAAYEYELSKRFGIKDILDIAIIMHVGGVYSYHRCRDIFDIPIIYYEDLIAEKEKALRPIFEICGLPFDALIGEALKEFKNDSQGGTALSQDKMKSVKDTPMNQPKIWKLREMCDQLDIPHCDPTALIHSMLH